MNEFMCQHLLVGITGSSNATGIHGYLHAFRENYAEHIKVIMSSSALTMVSPQTIELHCDDRVFVNAWDRSESIKTPHIQLTQWADIFLILPATANIIGKAAHGIADDLLSTAILSCRKPVVFAPAMNPGMWASPSFQRNLRQVKQDGHYVIAPVEGVSATTGKWDRGLAVPPPEEVVRHLQHVRLKSLRQEYWDEATRDKARTPLEKKMAELAHGDLTALPLADR